MPAPLSQRAPVPAGSTVPVGRSFYVAADGDDADTGADAAHPLRTLAPLNAIRRFGAGCRILLRGGDRFSGPLDLVLEGSAGAPCVLGSYGDGLATLTDTEPRTGAICRLSDSQHLRVERLRFLGTLGEHYGTRAHVPGNRCIGLAVTSTRSTGRRLRGTVITGCEFRHTFQGLWLDCESAPFLDGYDGVTLTDCLFDEVIQFGCYITGVGRIANGPTDQLRDVRVARNRFRRILGDPRFPSEAQALNVSGATGVVIERNRFTDCCGIGGVDAGVPNGGSTACGVSQIRDFRIAHNIVSGTKCSHAWDASGIDADQDAVNGEICYNLTYRNDGPGIQLGSFKGVVTSDLSIHHNVSIDDSRGCLAKSVQGSIRIWGNNHRVQIHHNTILLDANGTIGAPSCVNFEVGHNRDIVFANNVFKVRGGAPVFRANGGREGEYNATHIDRTCRFLGNCYDAADGRLVISNDDTRGAYRDIATLDEWRALGHERADDGTALGFAGDAGLVEDGAFVPPADAGLTAGIEAIAGIDLAPESRCRGAAIDVRPLLTLRAPIAQSACDYRGVYGAGAERDIGAVRGR